MIKRIYLPTVMISPRHLHQWAKDGDKQAQESLDKRSAEFNVQLQKAEAEMDEALNSGFRYAMQYESKGQWEEGVTFILHKPTTLETRDVIARMKQHAPERNAPDTEDDATSPNWKYLEDEFGAQG